jgi:hypothetical protein
MSESRKKILEMLAQGKINADEAFRLLGACGEEGQENRGHEDGGKRRPEVKTKPKYLRVTVTPEANDDRAHPDRVNVRIPMSLVRAGIKLTALIPPEALDKANTALKDKGINFDVRNIKPEDLEDLMEAMGDMEIDVEGSHGEKVKVFVE